MYTLKSKKFEALEISRPYEKRKSALNGKSRRLCGQKNAVNISW